MTSYDRLSSTFRHLLCVALGAGALSLGTAVDAAPPHHASSVRNKSHGDTRAAAKTRCIGVDHVAGAVVFGDRAVELSMNGGSRWRMTFAQACPALSFYQGFYYRRAIAGQLCAGRDAVIARSGGECPIDTIVKVAAARR